MDAALGDNQSLQCIVKLVLCPPVLKSKSQNRPAADMATAMPTAHKTKAESMIWKSPKARSWSSFGRQVSATSKSTTWNRKAHLLDVKSSPCGWPLRMYKIIITSDSCLTSKLPKSKQIKPTESAIMWHMNTNDTTVCNYIKCFFLLTWFIVDVEHHPSVNPSECLQITYSEFKDGTSSYIYYGLKTVCTCIPCASTQLTWRIEVNPQLRKEHESQTHQSHRWWKENLMAAGACRELAVSHFSEPFLS